MRDVEERSRGRAHQGRDRMRRHAIGGRLPSCGSCGSALKHSAHGQQEEGHEERQEEERPSAHDMLDKMDVSDRPRRHVELMGECAVWAARA